MKKMKMEQSTSSCELCGGEAAIYCGPDAAFLCWACDADVHGANFLVACHVRRVACSACRSLDDGARRVSGPGFRRPPRRYLCRSCGPDPETPSPPSPTASASSSSAISCLPTFESASGVRADAKRRRRRSEVEERVEGVLAGWSRRMALRTRFPCVATAARALRESRGKMASLPLRVSFSGALWYGMKLCGEAAEKGGREAALRRLEACSGVPSRLIDLAESRIGRSAGRVGRVEEGWGECS